MRLTPLKHALKGTFYGNLAFTHERANHFKDDPNEKKFIEGLANELAITINRVETVAAQQEAENRATAAEVMSAISSQSFELAHRLGNDLGLVSSYVDNIERSLKLLEINHPKVDKNLHKIVRDVGRVLNLSSTLKRDLAEFRSGRKISAEAKVISPEILLKEATGSLVSLPQNIQIHFELAKDIPNVYVVPSHVHDILHNLLSNAIQSMPAGGRITLSTRNIPRYVVLEVSDTGQGIAPEKQIRIFDFLYSTRNSSGFGLWSARRKALENGGDLKLKESRLGEGSTFVLQLPRAKE